MRHALPLLLLSSLAFATTLLAVDVPALSRTADVIVVGTVRTSTARLSQDGQRVITDTQIDVAEVLKGTPEGSSVVVMQPGGVVGNLGQRVEGTAQFTAAEEVLVFLERAGPSRFQVASMAQGKFRIERASDGHGVFALPQGASALLVDPQTGKETTSRLEAMSLQQLKAKISASKESR